MSPQLIGGETMNITSIKDLAKIGARRAVEYDSYTKCAVAVAIEYGLPCYAVDCLESLIVQEIDNSLEDWNRWRAVIL
jgi:hypothetical protein